MTKEDYCFALQEAPHYTDPDAFVSDMLLSSTFTDPDDPEAEPDLSLVPELSRLWTVAAAPFRELLAALGMSQTDCARRFCIPLRTVQNWAGELRTPPVYVRYMMAQLMGYISNPEED